MKKWTTWLIPCVLAAVLVLSACGQASVTEPTEAPEPIRIAHLGPLSGDVKLFGEGQRDGALLAIKEWNDKGGVLGRPIELINGDTKCDPKEASDVANKVIFEDGVHYIVGAVCSSASIPISEIANPNEVVQVTYSTNPQVTERQDGTCKDYVFRTSFLDSFQGRAGALFAYEELEARKAAVLFDVGNDYVKGLAGFFRPAFEEAGGEVVVNEGYTKDDTDFSAILSKVAEQEADVVYIPDYYPKANLVGAQAQEKGVEATFMGSDGWQTQDLDTEVLDGAYFTALFAPDSPRAQDFVEAYEQEYGETPDFNGALGYDGAQMLLTAIEEAGVDDPVKVRDALADVEYEGPTGKIVFEGCNNPTKPVWVHRVDAEEGFVFVDTFAP